MVTLHVSGNQVGTLENGAKVLVDLIAQKERIEFRDDSGSLLGRFVPEKAVDPDAPLVPWDPSITMADIERIRAEPGYSFEEVKKMLGWQ